MKPETSVIIPVRNGAQFVGEAIASVLAQLRDGDEVLVVDDGSTDETPAVLASVSHPAMRILSGGGRGKEQVLSGNEPPRRAQSARFPMDHRWLLPLGLVETQEFLPQAGQLAHGTLTHTA